MIYFDYSANTPVDPAVLEVYSRTAMKFFGNPNSEHTVGLAAAEEMRKVMEKLSDIFGIQPEELVFTSGASEANNLAIKGSARTQRHLGRHMISTALEHSSVSGTLTALKERGWEVDLARIGEDGKVDPEDLGELLRRDTVLVSVCAVDSELGTVQPIEKIRELLRDFPDCRLHVDATQAVGKLPFEEVRRIIGAADLVTFAPHKFYGLCGSGVLVRKKHIILEPLIHGGASTTLYRSGTPDVAGAAALLQALSLAVEEESQRWQKVSALNDLLREELSAVPGVCVNSPKDAVPHILNLGIHGIKGDRMQELLDREGICVSVKSACSVRGTPSRAVYAVSHDRGRALESWRVSLSHLTTEEEVDELIAAIKAAARSVGTDYGNKMDS